MGTLKIGRDIMSKPNRTISALARQIQSDEGLKYTEALRKAQWSTLVQQHPKYLSDGGELNELAKDYIPFIAELNPSKRNEDLYTWKLSGGIGSEAIDLVLLNEDGDIDYIGACGFFPIKMYAGDEENYDFVKDEYFAKTLKSLGGNKYIIECDPVFLDKNERIHDSEAFLFSVNGEGVEQVGYMLDLRGASTREEKIELAAKFVNDIVKNII